MSSRAAMAENLAKNLVKLPAKNRVKKPGNKRG